MAKSHKAQFGSISSGTMLKEDLIPAFIDELEWLNGHTTQLTRNITKAMNKEDYFDSEDASYDLEDLFDALNEFAPAYGYFGAHPGDGADYGFWLSECIEDDFDGLKVEDLSDIPDKYTGEVMHINDHGNMTLYVSKNGKLTEIWAVC